MIRPILIVIDNSPEMAKFSLGLKDAINSIVYFCQTNPYMFDNDICVMSFAGDVLLKTTVDKYIKGKISFKTSSKVTLDKGIRSILFHVNKSGEKPFTIIITCGTDNYVSRETIEDYRKSYISFVAVCLNDQVKCSWVEQLTNNPRMFNNLLLQDELNDLFVVPSFYVNDERDDNYITTV